MPKQSTVSPQLYRIGDLRELFGVHPNTIGRWVKSGRFPAPVKVHEGRSAARFWKADEIEALLGVKEGGL